MKHTNIGDHDLKMQNCPEAIQNYFLKKKQKQHLLFVVPVGQVYLPKRFLHDTMQNYNYNNVSLGGVI